jgi:type I restriction enzyme, S subunit
MSWEMVRLEDICAINMGKTPSRDEPKYWNGNNSWVAIADLKGDVLISKTKEGITDIALKESGIKPVSKGTLLYSFKLSIGKVAITDKILYTNEAIVSLPIKNTNQVDVKYLYYAIQQVDLTGIGDKAVKGVTLNKEKLKTLQIPLPPLATQQRIAHILDTADALRRKDQALLEKYDALAQAIFVDMFGDPVTNEKGWEVKKLGEVCEKIQIGPFGTQLHESDYILNGIPVINPMHIGDLKIKPNIKYSISKEKHDTLVQYHLSIGDVILARRGEMGRCAIVGKKEKGFLCGTGSIFISVDKRKIEPLFLVYVLSRKSSKIALENVAAGTTMANLNKNIMQEFKIILPDINKQKAFVKAIKISENNIELVNTSKLHTEMLFQSLLQSAFSGEME